MVLSTASFAPTEFDTPGGTSGLHHRLWKLLGEGSVPEIVSSLSCAGLRDEDSACLLLGSRNRRLLLCMLPFVMVCMAMQCVL